MSPIKNLTDEIAPRFPRLGKLRKGGEKTDKAFGPDLDHFRFTSDDPAVVEAFVSAYGNEPRLINVFIPHACPADAFQTWAEIWSATGLVHRCDGQNMTVWLDNGKYQRGSKPCPGGHEKNDYLNDAVGRLDVIIPELVMAGHVGYITLETHSKHDLLNIMAVLQAASDEGRRDLRGIPFVLRRVQESVSTPGFGTQAGRRSRVDKWLVRLEPHPDWVQVQIGMTRSVALEEPAAPLLPALDRLPALESEPVLESLPAQDRPEPGPALTIAEAVARTTPKGTSLGSLTDDQLKLVAEKAGNGLAEAASFLLDKAAAADWVTWYELFPAGAADLPASTTRIQLYRELQKAAQPL